VKGNLSRTGVDIFNFHFGRDVVRRCVGCCEAADVLLELSRVDYSRKRGKLVGPSHPVLLQLELHRRACACVYWVLDFCSCELLESMMTPEFDAFFLVCFETIFVFGSRSADLIPAAGLLQLERACSVVVKWSINEVVLYLHIYRAARRRRACVDPVRSRSLPIF
jgi:hypothetical protein